MTDFDKLLDHINNDPKPTSEPATGGDKHSFSRRVTNSQNEKPPIEQPLNIVESKPSATQKDTRE